MNPVSVFGGLLSGFVNYLQQRANQRDFTTAFDEISTLAQWIGGGLSGIADTMYQEWGAIGWVAQHLADIGDQVTNLELEHQRSLSWVTFTMLPNSLGYLEHEIYNGWIVPIQQWQARAWPVIVNTANSVTVLQRWRADYADPWILNYRQFREAFFAGDQPAINVLIDWLRNPSHFADFAVPRIADPLANYLNDASHEAVHKGFAYVMVDVWDDEAGAIWDAVARWLVSDT